MKEYSGDLNLNIENGHDGPYFIPDAYDIEPKNMEKRIRVFINQLLPGIVRGVQGPEDVKWSLEVLGRHARRFGLKLIEADMPDEYLMVLIAVSETTTQILKKQQELIQHEQGKITEVPE